MSGLRSSLPFSLPPSLPPSVRWKQWQWREGRGEERREGGSLSFGLDRSKEGEGIKLERRTQEEVKEKAREEKGR